MEERGAPSRAVLMPATAAPGAAARYGTAAGSGSQAVMYPLNAEAATV